MKSNTSGMIDQAIEHKGSILIKPHHKGEISIHELNSRNFMKFELGWEHPPSTLSSYEPSPPADFYESHLGKDMEALPHTINENSNESFLTFGPEKK